MKAIAEVRRKRFLASVFALVTSISIIVIPANAMNKTFQSNLSPAIATVYTELLEDSIFRRLGVTPLGYPADNNSPDASFSACTLVDFEKDNQPELLIIYTDPSSADVDYCEVWGIQDGKAVNLATQRIEMSTGNYGITQVAGKTYVVMELLDSVVRCYGVQNGKWFLAKSFIGPLAVDDPYEIDGKTVQQTVYKDTYQKWYGAAEFFPGGDAYELRGQAIMRLYQQISPRLAMPATAKLSIDGQIKTLDSYVINGHNYYKLRDIAKLLVGTSKEACVDGSGTGVYVGDIVEGVRGKYTAVGTELTIGGTTAQTVDRHIMENFTVSSGRVVTDAYTFAGYNYFAIRDLGCLFNFGVSWNSTTNTVTIDTNKGYTAE